MERVVIRADGSTTIGLGHVMRCLTLAGALKKTGAEVRLITKGYSDAAPALISKAGFDCRIMEPDLGLVDDMWFTVRAAKECGASAIVCDGYWFDAAYMGGIKDAGLRLAVIDDIADRELPADVVINQNVYATEDMYRGITPPGARLLLGTGFCMVRDEFRVARGNGRVRTCDVREVLVTLGGADPSGMTLRVLRALDTIEVGFRVTAVMGAATPDDVLNEVRGCAVGSSREVELILAASNMAELMARADLAVTASGSTSYETACLGLPTVSMSIADNQDPVGQGMGGRGASLYVGRAGAVTDRAIADTVGGLTADADRRADMSARGMALVDGEGAARVAEVVIG